MEFEKYVDEYSEILARVQDKDAALVILGNVAKDRRVAAMNGNGKHGYEKASQKQLEFLKDLGVEAKPGLTRAEASKLIDSAVARQK